MAEQYLHIALIQNSLKYFKERFMLTDINVTPLLKQISGQEQILKTQYLFLKQLRVFRACLILYPAHVIKGAV